MASTEECKTEFLKATSDHLKLITTLSSGFIALMVTFLEKLFDQPQCKGLVVFSFLAFALATLLSVISQNYVISFLSPDEKDTDSKANRTANILNGTWVCFIVGVFSMMMFGVVNFI